MQVSKHPYGNQRQLQVSYPNSLSGAYSTSRCVVPCASGTQRAYAALQGLSNGIGSPRWNPAVTKQAVASLVCFISNCLQHLAQGPIYERAVLCSLLSQSTNVLHRLCSLQQGTREEASKSFKLVDTLCCGLNLLCKLQITRTDTLALMTTNAPNSKLPQDFPAQAIDSLPPFSSHALAAIRACILLIGELDTAVPDVLLHISTALPMLCSWAVGGDLQQPVHAQIMPAQAKATCSSYIHADTAVQAAALTALLRMASEVNCVQLLRCAGYPCKACPPPHTYTRPMCLWCMRAAGVKPVTNACITTHGHYTITPYRSVSCPPVCSHAVWITSSHTHIITCKLEYHINLNLHCRQHGLLAEAVMAAEKYSGDSASWTAGSSPHSQARQAGGHSLAYCIMPCLPNIVALGAWVEGMGSAGHHGHDSPPIYCHHWPCCSPCLTHTLIVGASTLGHHAEMSLIRVFAVHTLRRTRWHLYGQVQHTARAQWALGACAYRWLTRC